MQVADDRYQILGTPFRVVTDHAQTGDAIRKMFSPFVSGRAARGSNTFVLRRPGASHTQFRLYRDCQYLFGAPEWPNAVVALAAELNRRAIDSLDTFAAHAAVLDLGGSAVAFPAESGAGKTTLTTAGVMAGLGYVSDESLCLDPVTEEVVPYPRPLLLSPESLELLGIEDTVVMNASEAAVLPSDLGRVMMDRLPLDHVVFAEYGHDEASLEPVESGEIMATLLRMSFNNYKDPEVAFRLAASVAGRVDGWQLRYGDPFDAIELLRERLA